jgi:hypothetical protein
MGQIRKENHNMKNYLSLSNLSAAVTRIVPCISSKPAKRKTRKENAFVVLNSDNDYGFYVRRLAREISKYPELREIPKSLRRKSFKAIETGNLIVFGDCNGSTDYDFRIEEEARNLDHLDGRRFKAYDIINDFDKVLKKLKAYASDNDNLDEEEGHTCCGKKKSKSEVETIDININVNTHAKPAKYTHNIAILRNEVLEEKVTVFNNWVKVGYNQYDIYCDLFGNEFIYINGQKFGIEKDRRGKKYLV